MKKKETKQRHLIYGNFHCWRIHGIYETQKKNGKLGLRSKSRQYNLYTYSVTFEEKDILLVSLYMFVIHIYRADCCKLKLRV